MANDGDILTWDDLHGEVVVVTDDPVALATLAPSATSGQPSVSPDHPWRQAGYRDPVPQRLWTSRNVETLRRWHVQELKRRINAWRFRRTRDR